MAIGRHRDLCTKDARADEALIYIHIPKCAGTTMMSILRNNYGSQFHHVPIGKWDKFRGRQGTKCLAGHLPYGLHRHLPGEYIYATMLRNPVDRVVSLCRFVQRFKKHRWHNMASKMSLVEFVKSSNMADMRNGMTRWLSGRQDVGRKRSTGPVTESDFERAKIHLQRMPIVGFVETFDESLAIFAHMLGWSDISYEKRMVGKYQSVLRKVRRAVRDVNEFDARLYDWARTKL